MSTISFFGTLVDTINEHYELPEILNVTVMPSLRSHASGPDSVYQITTKAKSYVLRPFRTEISAAIQLHNHFLRWAAQNGFAMTQRIIQTRSGNDFFESEEQKWWLSSYIEADPVFEWTKPTWTVEICAQSGAALSSLHQELRQFATENPSILKHAKTDGSVLCSLEKRLEESFSRSSKFAEQWRLVAPLVSRALVLIQKNDSAVEQLVHGDFHPGNLLFKDGVAVAIIDFEYLNIEDAIYDLAYSLVMFCTMWTVSDGMIDMQKLQAFLRGYLCKPSEVDSAPPRFDSQPSEFDCQPSEFDSAPSEFDCQRSKFDVELLLPYMRVAAAICLTWFLERELEDRTVQHFINVVKQLENLSTMDISRAIGRA